MMNGNEANRSEQYPEWVNYAINHEMKAVVAFALMQHDGPSRASQISETIDDMQGSAIVFNSSTPKQFCQQSLAPAGFTNTTEVEYLKLGMHPATATGFGLTDYGIDHGIGILGNIAKWSLDNPDLTLKDVMGVTQSKRKDVGGSSHGTSRFLALKSLVDNTSQSLSDLVGELSEDTAGNIVRGIVDELVCEGIAEKSSSIVYNQRTFRIVNPKYEPGERKKAFEKLVPEKQALFKLLGIAVTVRDVWAIDDFMRMAEAYDDNPESLKKLNFLVQHLLAPSVETTHNYIKNESVPVYSANGERSYSSVRLSDKHRQSVTDLVGIIQGHIEEDKQLTDKGVENAHAIIEDQTAAAELIAKPRRTSALVIKDPEFDWNLAEIVKRATVPMSAKQVHHEYEEVSGRKVGVHTVSIHLWDLTKNGLLQAGDKVVRGKKVVAPVYTSL